MGFRIEYDVDTNVEEFLRILRAAPYKVFSRPYAGYLLFLAGGADKEAVEWLQENALILDSLTGDEIAFAVFAERVPIKAKRWGIGAFNKMIDIDRTSNEVSVGEIQDSLENRKEQYKKRDKGIHVEPIRDLSWRIDEEEIVAMTYAVDRLAKDLQVTAHLPCMVVLDAIPGKSVETISLKGNQASAIVPLLREVLQKMSSRGELKKFIRTLTALTELDSNREEHSRNLEGALRDIDAECSLFDLKTRQYRESLGKYEKWIKGIHRLWRQGRGLRTLREALALNPRPDWYSWRFYSIVRDEIPREEFERRSRTFLNTYQLLQRCRQAHGRARQSSKRVSWPLSEDERPRLQQLHRDVVVPIIGAGDLGDLSQLRREDWLQVVEKLKLERIRLEEDLMAIFPPVSGLERAVEARIRALAGQKLEIEKNLPKRKKAIRRQHEIEQLEMDEEFTRLSQQLSEYRISLTEFVIRSAKKRKLLTATEKVKSEFLSTLFGWMQPQTLLNLWKFIS